MKGSAPGQVFRQEDVVLSGVHPGLEGRPISGDEADGPGLLEEFAASEGAQGPGRGKEQLVLRCGKRAARLFLEIDRLGKRGRGATPRGRRGTSRGC